MVWNNPSIGTPVSTYYRGVEATRRTYTLQYNNVYQPVAANLWFDTANGLGSLTGDIQRYVRVPGFSGTMLLTIDATSLTEMVSAGDYNGQQYFHKV